MDFPDAAQMTAIATAVGGVAGVVVRWLGRKERAEIKQLRADLDDCTDKHTKAMEREKKSAAASAQMIETIVRMKRSIGDDDDTGVHRLLEHKREILLHASHEAQQVVVLLVDDDAAARRSVQRVLEHQGFSVASVSGALTALQELAERRYDIVVADLLMPGHSGVDLLREIRRDYPRVPVILISGEEKLGAALAGAEGVRFLAKPFTGAALTAMITEALENP
jgi:CheY-like chemotaxis protein